MSKATELKSHALSHRLPEQVFTRSRSTLDPSQDVWEWTDGPFIARLDFRRLNGNAKFLKEPLKEALIPLSEGAFIEAHHKSLPSFYPLSGKRPRVSDLGD